MPAHVSFGEISEPFETEVAFASMRLYELALKDDGIDEAKECGKKDSLIRVFYYWQKLRPIGRVKMAHESIPFKPMDTCGCLHAPWGGFHG